MFIFKKFEGKLADRVLASDEYQKSWKVHMDAFGPILQPAFREDSTNRLELLAALNIISNGNYKTGKKKLLAIKKACRTDADKAAWAYFMGLLYEHTDNRRQMISHYSVCCNYDHRFYLPYLKLAKYAHEDSVFDVAEENYRKALGCLDDIPPGQADQKEEIRAALHANLAACLLMMHRSAEARSMLNEGLRLQPDNASMLPTLAMLQAAEHQADAARATLARIESEGVRTAVSCRKIVESILDGSNFHFCIQPAREDLFEDFWQKFAGNEEKMGYLVDNDEDDQLERLFAVMISPLFPYADGITGFSFRRSVHGHMQLDLNDGYSLSLKDGFERLINSCPAEIKGRWEFTLSH